MSVWDVFKARGFFKQATDEQGVKEIEGQITAYIGFDPTADSFHVGHLIPLMSLLHLQREGHRPIALVGGGTAMIGDPTGKNEMRKMLSEDELDQNIQALQGQLNQLLQFSSNTPASGDSAGSLMVNNAEWLKELNYISFLREIGPHFSVNRMLTFETFKIRLEGAGLSFIEFNYPLLQSYDFLELYRRHGCMVQLGGDDQWANIISGVELVRRMERKTVYGWTFPLLTTPSGAKMGKTEKGAVWLDPAKTTPYEYFQYWVNIDDSLVAQCLGLFTLLPMDEVNRLAALQGADIREAKAVLAFEATQIIHGEAEAEKAKAGAAAAFGKGGGNISEVPSSSFSLKRLSAGVLMIDILSEAGLAKSKSEARRLIQGGAVKVNGERAEGLEYVLNESASEGGEIMIQVGKKKFHRLILNP